MWYEWAGVLACWYFQIYLIVAEGKYSSGIQFLHRYSLGDVTCPPVWGREIDCVCLCSNLTGGRAAVDSSMGGVSVISFSQRCLPVSRGRFDTRFVIADRNRWALYCQGPCLYGNVNWVSPADRTVDPTVPAASSGWQQPCSRGWEKPRAGGASQRGGYFARSSLGNAKVVERRNIRITLNALSGRCLIAKMIKTSHTRLQSTSHFANNNK